MSGKYFRFSDVLGYGWHVMKNYFWFFVGVGFIWLIISYATTIIDYTARHTIYTESVPVPFKILIPIVNWVINIALGIGIVKIALSFCEGRKPTVGTLFDFMGCFWRYLGAAILYMLIIIAGFILLIVPGIVWGVKYGLWPYFVIDKGLSPTAALKASAQTTMGVKWDLFGFGIVCALINLAGLLCLIIGIFAAYPMVIVAYALVYRQLAAQTPELAVMGIIEPPVIEGPANHFEAR
jgi:hypothetical protein